MAILQFKGFYTPQTKASLVVAGAQDTPGITSPNPVFEAVVDWGDGGQQNVTYNQSSNNGIIITDKKVHLIHTDNDSQIISHYNSRGLRLISIEGGWKNSASDTESYLALPKQSTTRYPSNTFLNNKRGPITLSIEKYALDYAWTKALGKMIKTELEGEDLVFKFNTDYVGLRSSDNIKLVKEQNYNIGTNNVNFRLDENSELDTEYSDGIIRVKTQTGFIKYFYDLNGVTYSSEFEIVDSVDTNIAPPISEWSKMLTHRHLIDQSSYNSFDFNGNSLVPANKNKAFRINLGPGFKLHGVGDFANYNMQRVENMAGHTQAFSGAMDHTFAACRNFKFSTVLKNLDMSNVTSLRGFMSGCDAFLEHWMIQDLSSNLTDLTGAYEFSSFKANNVKRWDVSQTTSVESLFEHTVYDRAGMSDSWNTQKISNFKNMFKNNIKFAKYLGTFNLASAETLEGMFYNTRSYNAFSNAWNTQNVKSFKNMFRGASSFNKAIGNWKTGSAETMEGMFKNASAFDQKVFDQGNGKWDTSNVESMESMFENSSFSNSVNSWKIGKVKSFKNMFKENDAFNHALPNWSTKFAKTQNVESDSDKEIDFEGMFESSVFNQPVKGWDVSHAISVKNMFKNNTTFNSQLFPGWRLKGTKCEDVTEFLAGATALSALVSDPGGNLEIKNVLKTYGNTIKNAKGFPILFGYDDGPFLDDFKNDVFKNFRLSWEQDNTIIDPPGGGGDGDGMNHEPDTEAPVITLVGNAEITLEKGLEYTDLGATWSDNVDGNGTINGAGSVDINTVGTYQITYDKTDAAGNSADSVVRTITIVDSNSGGGDGDGRQLFEDFDTGLPISLDKNYVLVITSINDSQSFSGAVITPPSYDALGRTRPTYDDLQSVGLSYDTGYTKDPGYGWLGGNGVYTKLICTAHTAENANTREEFVWASTRGLLDDAENALLQDLPGTSFVPGHAAASRVHFSRSYYEPDIDNPISMHEEKTYPTQYYLQNIYFYTYPHVVRKDWTGFQADLHEVSVDGTLETKIGSVTYNSIQEIEVGGWVSASITSWTQATPK